MKSCVSVKWIKSCLPWHNYFVYFIDCCKGRGFFFTSVSLHEYVLCVVTQVMFPEFLVFRVRLIVTSSEFYFTTLQEVNVLLCFCMNMCCMWLHKLCFLSSLCLEYV